MSSEPKFTSANTDDWRSLAEANRAKKSSRKDALGQSQVKRDDALQPNVFGAKNLAVVAALLVAGYIVDGALSGKRVDGQKGGPFRKMVDAISAPLRRLFGGGSGGRGGWKEKSPAEMARLAAEKRSGTQAGGKKKKGKAKRR